MRVRSAGREDLQQRQLGAAAGELAGRGSGGCRSVSQPFQQLVECLLPVVDGGSLVVGERNGDEHPLQVGLRFEQLCPEEFFGM